MVNAFSVVLLLFFATHMYAQPSDNRKLQQEEQKPSKAKQEKRSKQEDAKPTHEGQDRKAEQKPSKAKHEKASKQENAKSTHAGQDRKTGKTERQDRKTAEAKHGRAGKGAHIPDDKFRAHFGRQHTFVVSRPVIVEGHPRFRYASYWFEIVDPWPVGWAYTDSCYIDFIDGEYFLFDLLHPGVRVVVFVVG
jgi:hypothetical protein